MKQNQINANNGFGSKTGVTVNFDSRKSETILSGCDLKKEKALNRTLFYYPAGLTKYFNRYKYCVFLF